MPVRYAEPDDAAAIAAVHVRSWQAGYRGMLPGEVLDSLSVEERERAWSELIGGDAVVLVAEEGGTVAGFCTVLAPGRDPDGVPEIGALYVEPDRWGSGVGRELLDAVRREVEPESDALVVWVMAANAPGLAFYERLGFERDGAEKQEPVASLAHDDCPVQVRLRARLR